MILCWWDAALSQMCMLNRDEDRCVSHKRAQRPISRPFSPEGARDARPSFCQSGPAARWHPSPWRRLNASPDGNCAARATTSPSFHLLTPAFAAAAFFFCPRRPGFVLDRPPFMSPHHALPFHQNPPKKCEGRGGETLTDLVFYMELGLALAPQSTAILPWPSR